MAIVKSYTIPDEHIPELIEVFGASYNTQVLDTDGITLIPNPQTKANFASQNFDDEVRSNVFNKVKKYRRMIKLAEVSEVSILE